MEKAPQRMTMLVAAFAHNDTPGETYRDLVVWNPGSWSKHVREFWEDSEDHNFTGEGVSRFIPAEITSSGIAVPTYSAMLMGNWRHATDYDGIWTVGLPGEDPGNGLD